MSYILDALQKSQAQREQSEPVVAPFPAELPPAPRRLLGWLWLLALLLVGAGLGWLISSDRPTVEPPILPAATQLTPPTSPRTSLDTAPHTAQAASSHTAPDNASLAQAEPPVAQLSDEVVLAQAPEVSAAPPVETAPSPQLTDITQQVTEPTSPATVANVEIRTLPPLASLRKVPAILINSHIYSPIAELRTVTINNRAWQVGEPLAPDVVLQEITAKGIRLSVDGYALNIDKKQGWQPLDH